MNILINASNLKVGGGIQVADSVCRELCKYQHNFVVIYTDALNSCVNDIKDYKNVETIAYETPLDIKTTLSGRDNKLDSLVAEKRIDAVLTIFGPSRWRPSVPHLSGFAKPQLVLPESPFWKQLSFIQWLKYQFRNRLTKYSFDKCADNYFTENPLISERLQQLFPHKKVFTVTNNANQVFLHLDQCDNSIVLPTFDGLTMLTVTANYPHKNLPIIIKTCHYLEEHHADLNFRFILTVHESDLIGIDECARKHIVFLGPVKINQVPLLYEKCDIMVLPTLLECFSASYAEAMLMKRPILTTDLIFARGLCGDAAFYYSATSHEALGEAVVKLYKDKDLRQQLVSKGEQQLKKFDTFEKRAKKLIELTEMIVKMNKQ